MDTTKTDSALDLLYTETRDRVVRQLEDNRSLSTKASVVTGFAGAIPAGAIALLPNLGDVAALLAPFPKAPILIPLGGLGLLATLLSLSCGIAAYWCRQYREILDPRAAYKEFQSVSEYDAKVQLLHTMIDTYEKNQKQIDRKAALVKWSLLMLGFGALCFTLLSAHVLLAVALTP